ncbi:MAG: zinc-binding dehydrogenase [Oscillospiraceae bacterium]|nr:zinc-binding dehydrogenase [Oscillospiraceae bacterium]
MRTKAVRLYGKNDLRLEEFDLPAIGEGDILAKVVSDSICMSSYKAAVQGKDHKRVPDDIDVNPIIIGHEFCGEILEVGPKWRSKFRPGGKFAIQPALSRKEDPYSAPGYSFTTVGGNTTHVVIPSIIMECGCLLDYDCEAYFYGSLAEPMSCIVGAFHASYHTVEGRYDHVMGIVPGGAMALLAGAGPMGLGFIDYALHADVRPKVLVVTDIDQARLDRAATIFPTSLAKVLGISLTYVNTAEVGDPKAHLIGLAGGEGFDDVFVLAPVRPVVELGDSIMRRDGCLNFFAGPTDPNFSAMFNFYNVHYGATHIVGTSGGNKDDMIESVRLMEAGRINPTPMVTHVGGLDSVVETTLGLPKIPGGKKLVYNNVSMRLTAIADFAEEGRKDPLFAGLDEITRRHNGLWSAEAERYLLANAKPI